MACASPLDGVRSAKRAKTCARTTAKPERVAQRSARRRADVARCSQRSTLAQQPLTMASHLLGQQRLQEHHHHAAGMLYSGQGVASGHGGWSSGHGATAPDADGLPGATPLLALELERLRHRRTVVESMVNAGGHSSYSLRALKVRCDPPRGPRLSSRAPSCCLSEMHGKRACTACRPSNRSTTRRRRSATRPSGSSCTSCSSTAPAGRRSPQKTSSSEQRRAHASRGSRPSAHTRRHGLTPRDAHLLRSPVRSSAWPSTATSPRRRRGRASTSGRTPRACRPCT